MSCSVTFSGIPAFLSVDNFFFVLLYLSADLLLSSIMAAPKRSSTGLTIRLIDQISSSVEVFKPSASLYALAQAAQEEDLTPKSSAAKEPTEIDLVVSGGGLKGYFACGAYAVLQQHLIQNNIKIARVSGSSAGAWSALFIGLNFISIIEI